MHFKTAVSIYILNMPVIPCFYEGENRRNTWRILKPIFHVFVTAGLCQKVLYSEGLLQAALIRTERIQSFNQKNIKRNVP
jgi:hypothetical protein